MDDTDKKILDLIKGNARMSYQELGDLIGMSRVAAKKRVQKLEKEGIIRGYNTCIYRNDDVTVFIDVVTIPEKYEDVLEFVSTKVPFIRQIFRTTKEYHIHIVAASYDSSDLKYLIKMIRKNCGEYMKEFECHAVKEIVKDVYGGKKYEQKSVPDIDRSDEQAGGDRSS